MSGVRHAFLDVSPGERRGVVTLDGRPERLWIEREGEAPYARTGERRRVRVGARSPDRRQAFVDLGGGVSGVLRLAVDLAVGEGAMVEAEVAAEPYADKAARLTYIGEGPPGTPGLIAPALKLEARLAAAAPGVPVEQGGAARAAADLAEEAALAMRHTLKGGVGLTIEPTRALTAIDVDLAELARGGGKHHEANLRAIRHAARLLRLKSIGGLTAIDLVGAPKAAGLLRAEAERAFAPDGPESIVLPPNRLGVLMVSKPHLDRPLAERLLDAEGRPSSRTLAQRLVRALEREGRVDPGGRLVAFCSPDIADDLAPLVAALGPRYGAVADPALGRDDAHIERR